MKVALLFIPIQRDKDPIRASNAGGGIFMGQNPKNVNRWNFRGDSLVSETDAR